MKKYAPILIACLIAFPVVAQAKNAKAYCTMYGSSAKHGYEAKISSEHGFSILNDSTVTKSYHITFENNVNFGGTWYSPNGHKEIDVTVEAGKTLHYGPEILSKSAFFGVKGNYDLQALTIIMLDGKMLTGCSNNHFATIF